jgi:hypothetical protein
VRIVRRAAFLAGCALLGCGDADPGEPDAGPRFEQVGHEPLLARGMNAAPAVVGDRMFIGSRTEGETHDDAGILIVDIADPAAPRVVGQIGPPDEALLGMTSRELRAVPDKGWLVVLEFACSVDIHACTRDTNRFGTRGTAEPDSLKIYDVSGAAPALLSATPLGRVTITTVNLPHEFFLWRDPADADRILLYVSMPLAPPSLWVLDISDPLAVQTIATYDPYAGGAAIDEPPGDNTAIHSVSVSDDGRTAYLSMTGAGLVLADTSQVADGVADPVIAPLTTAATRVDYSPPHAPGTHSAATVPERDLLVVTDEIYPAPIGEGCPYGWTRIVDIADPTEPAIAGEYRLGENDPARCAGTGPDRVTYTAHNATATENLALVTWHAAGLHAIDLADPTAPAAAAVFLPEPLASVQTEDPALGGEPVLMWSVPIVRDGLVYVVDIRNGLYVLRYHGPHEDELANTSFAEGNSNL